MKEPNINNIQWYDKQVTFERIIKSMYHEQFDIHDLGVSSRVFTHWKKENLIPFIQVRKRVKLNVYEYFWIQILKDLRSLGFPIALMRKVKECCYQQLEGGGDGKVNIDQNGNEFTMPRDRRFNSIGELKLVTDTELMTYQNSEEKPTKDAQDFLNQTSEDMALSLASNLLYFMITETVVSGKDVKLFVNGFGDVRYNGMLGFETDPRILKERGITDESLEPFITLSLNKYFYQLISSPRQTEKVRKLEIFNPVEMEVIKAIRAGSAKEVKILFDCNNGHKDIVTTYKGVATKEEFENTLLLFRDKKHVELQLKSTDGHTTIYEYSNRKRFKD